MRSRSGYATDHRQRPQKHKRECQDRRRAGAADADRRAGGHRRRGDRSGSFGKLVAFGLGGVLVEVLKDITFRLAPATRSGCALDARRHRGGRDPARRARRARRSIARRSPALIVNVSQLVADFPEIAELDLNPVFATAQGAIAADVRIVRRFRAAAGALSPGHGRNPDGDEPHHEARRGRGHRRLGRGRQDRQLGDEEPHQRRLPGRDLPDPPEGRRRSWAARPTRASRTCRATIDVAVFAIPAKFVAQALVECGEKKIAGAVLIPSGFAETGNVEGQHEIVSRSGASTTSG